jgi:hypothetical protein
MVKATLNGFEAIMQVTKRYDYINLLSGQDYPLQDVGTIHDFLDKNPGKIFCEFLLINSEWKEAKQRVTKYFFTDTPFFGSYFLETLISTVLPKRKMPLKLIPVGKSQWFTISLLHANYLLDYLLDRPQIENFFRHTWGSDELFFQTLLYNSDYQSDMVNNNLRYIDWSEGKPSPKTLTIQDADALIKSDKFFGRKFNSNIESKILDYLDKAAEENANKKQLDTLAGI